MNSDQSDHVRRFGMRSALALLAGGLAIVIALLVPIPYKGRAVVAIGDLVHTPMFFGITLVLLFAMDHYWPNENVRRLVIRAVILAFALCSFGVLMEYAQDIMGRTKNMYDALANACGILAAVCVYAFWHFGKARVGAVRWVFPLLVVACFYVGWNRPVGMLADTIDVYRSFPTLSSFESKYELQRWYGRNCVLTRTTSHASDGEFALQVDYPNRDYASVTLVELNEDWRQMESLTFDLTLSKSYSDKAKVCVKVIDRKPDQRQELFRSIWSVAPGETQTIRIDRDAIVNGPEHRKLDLSQIQYFEIVLLDPKQPTSIHLDNLRLNLGRS